MTRRDLISGLGALAWQETPAPRPIICLASKHLAKLHYSELGGALSQLGFEGCDLAVRSGGHVLPEKAPADLVRAVESVRGEGVEVPMISTDLVAATDPYARNVLGLAGQVMKVPYFKPGYYRYGAEPVEETLVLARRNLAGLVGLGRAYGIAAGIHNHSGMYVGHAVWDTRAILADLDPRWAGYYFDPCHATAEGAVGGWKIALRVALPRLKMLAVKDFLWEEDKGKWSMKACPMGQGMVDWPQVFDMMAEAHFAGPLSLQLDYHPEDELAAISRDVAYLKKLVSAAYGSS